MKGAAAVYAASISGRIQPAPKSGAAAKGFSACSVIDYLDTDANERWLRIGGHRAEAKVLDKGAA